MGWKKSTQFLSLMPGKRSYISSFSHGIVIGPMCPISFIFGAASPAEATHQLFHRRVAHCTPLHLAITCQSQNSSLKSVIKYKMTFQLEKRVRVRFLGENFRSFTIFVLLLC